MASLKQIKEKLTHVDSTKIFFTDLNGRHRSLPVNPENVESIIRQGIGFDGSSVAGIATVDDSDRILLPIRESFRVVEFKDEKLAFFVGKIQNARGERSKSDPRAVLENVLTKAESEYGCKFLLGPEHEFFLLKGNEFNEAIHSDSAGYFHSDPHDKGEVVRKKIIEVLAKCSIRFEKAHHEVTASQHEINLECLEPLGAADRTVLFNYVTQKVAAENGLHATFMPKPFNGQNRNAFHIHLSMMDKKGKTRIRLGDSEFEYSKRRSYLRCEYVCGGFTGLHPSGKWSTWSPGRFPIPKDDAEFGPALVSSISVYHNRPDMGGGFYHSLMRGKLYQSCGNCQLVCHPNKEERKRRYQMLRRGGVVVQHPDGTLEAMPPEEAASHVSAMDPETRALYEKIESRVDERRSLEARTPSPTR